VAYPEGGGLRSCWVALSWRSRAPGGSVALLRGRLDADRRKTLRSVAMRILTIALFAGVFVLLLALTIKVAGIDRSLRRLEREERRRNLVVWLSDDAAADRLLGTVAVLPMYGGAGRCSPVAVDDR